MLIQYLCFLTVVATAKSSSMTPSLSIISLSHIGFEELVEVRFLKER